MELIVLATLVNSRENWEQAKGHVEEIKKEFSPEGGYLVGKIGDYYSTDPNAERVDVEVLCAAIRRELPSVKRAERICAVLGSLPKDSSDANVLKELSSIKRNNVGVKLAGLLSVGKESSEVVQLMEEYLTLSSGTMESSKENEVLTQVPVSELIAKHFDKSKCFKLYPKALDDAVEGQAKPGHHILIFAPTEMGKTLVVINLAAGFVVDGHRVLYIGNEDPEADIYMRFMTRVTRMNKYEINENPEKAQQLLDKRNYGNFILAPLAPGNFHEIRKLVDIHKPEIVIIDQLRNLDVNSEGRTQQLERAATEARNLAKSRKLLVVSVTQAGDSASGKTVLGRGDVDSSNVGIPGQVDLMIGVGATADQEVANWRTISMCKNKLSGRHVPFQVQIDPLTSRVIE